jgi:hypothetical protein
LLVAAEKREETNAQRRKEAEQRQANAKKFEAWSVKVEKKERKILRREKKDRKKDWEAKEEKRLLEAGGGLAGTPQAVLHRKKVAVPQEPTVKEDKPIHPVAQSDASEEEDSDLAEDYREVREAQRGKRAKPTGGMAGGGMFDDMM